TRAKIPRVTRKIIDTEGREAGTLRSGGAEGGLSRGAAYRHCAHRDELPATIALEDVALLRQRLMPLPSRGRDSAEPLMTIMEQFYEFGIANRVHYQLMFGVVWEPETYPVLHERGKIFFEQIRQITENLLLVNGHAHHDSTNRTAMLFAFMHGLVQLHLA